MRAQSAAPTRAARPPPPPQPRSSSPGSKATAAGSTAASETQLRRRLTEVEMRLRDLDDDAKRMRVHQEQEIATLEKDNKRLRDRLEELRMEECLTPAETRAMQAHLHIAHGTNAHAGESKLLGATSAKYQQAKAAVEAKRRECAQAEGQLAEVRRQLVDVRQQRKQLKQQFFATKASAGARMAAAQRYKVQVRDQLRGLEEQVAREQERFSKMVVDAKKMRTAIDALLVNQTGNEKMYTKRYDALQDKRKEMAYLMEVCNSLCEERQHVNAELQELKTHLAEENKQYEAAFHELSGVSEENAAVQATNKEKIDELRRLIAQTRSEREALEAENAKTKAALERHRHRSVSRRLNSEGRPGSASERDFIRRAPDSDDEEAGSGYSRDPTKRSAGEGGVRDTGSVNSNDSNLADITGLTDMDSHTLQIREFEEYFQKLANIVQSDVIEDVVGFIDVAADERYRCFDEMNAIKRDIAELTAEKAALTAALVQNSSATASNGNAANSTAATPGQVESRDTTSALAALAEVNSIEELAAAATDPRSVRPSPSVEGSAEATSSSPTAAPAAAALAARAARMAKLQADLDKARDAVAEQDQQQEECAVVLSQVIAQVNEMFRGLGCSVQELRSVTGLEGVQQSTLLPCLSIVEQRTEEYLIAYSRAQHHAREQQALNVWGEQPTHTASSHGGSHNAARTVLRRPDLLPKSKSASAAQVAAQQPLPRSTDMAAVMPTVSLDATRAASLEDLVEERPLTDAELREVVEAKRALMRH